MADNRKIYVVCGDVFVTKLGAIIAQNALIEANYAEPEDLQIREYHLDDYNAADAWVSWFRI